MNPVSGLNSLYLSEEATIALTPVLNDSLTLSAVNLRVFGPVFDMLVRGGLLRAVHDLPRKG